MKELNVLISSVGRRLYLVEWFRAAMSDLHVSGQTLVADSDPYAPALTAGDDALILPSFAAPDYPDRLLELCEERSVGLLLTLNDYEAMVIGETVLPQLEARGIRVPILGASGARLAADKWQTAATLADRGVAVPRSALGSEILRNGGNPVGRAEEIVVKHRFGSASSGLLFGTASDIDELVLASARTAPDERGSVLPEPRPELVLVQERVRGSEFGVDVVSDFDGCFRAAFARKKLRMRAGETDQAVTVEGAPFVPVAAAVQAVTRSKGLLDMDVLVDAEGVPHVIDVNPRFGGGYPFSHLAGANVPACFVAWTVGLPVLKEWMAPCPGVAGAKYPSVVQVPYLASQHAGGVR